MGRTALGDRCWYKQAMPRPTSRAELLEAMSRECALLMSEINDLDPGSREIAGACEAWSVKDILAHLDAWHEMFLLWESAGVAGESIEMPAPGFTWKDTPGLNEQIFEAPRLSSTSHGRAESVPSRSSPSLPQGEGCSSSNHPYGRIYPARGARSSGGFASASSRFASRAGVGR